MSKLKSLVNLLCLGLALLSVAAYDHYAKVMANPGLYIGDTAAEADSQVKPFAKGGPRIVTLDVERTVVLSGVVGPNALANAASVLAMTAASSAPIYLVVNSPGGMVATGAVLMESMRLARKAGVSMQCVVMGAAYSMGFNVLTECSQVYFTKESTLLFHPIRVQLSGIGLGRELMEVGQQLDALDQLLIGRIQSFTGMPMELVIKAYYSEHMWDGISLEKHSANGWIIAVDEVRNVPSSVYAWHDMKTRRGTDAGALLEINLNERRTDSSLQKFNELMRAVPVQKGAIK